VHLGAAWIHGDLGNPVAERLRRLGVELIDWPDSDIDASIPPDRVIVVPTTPGLVAHELEADMVLQLTTLRARVEEELDAFAASLAAQVHLPRPTSVASEMFFLWIFHFFPSLFILTWHSFVSFLWEKT
jgi:hypothetical protein